MQQWECQPQAEKLIQSFIGQAVASNGFIATLQAEMLTRTSTHLQDWLDHLIVGHNDELEKELEEAGFESEQAGPSYRAYHHPGAQLPRIVVDDNQREVGLAITVESIADFLMAHRLTGKIEGSPFSGYRRCLVSAGCWVIERRGSESFEPTNWGNEHLGKYIVAREAWQSRPRDLEDDDEAMKRTLLLAEEIIEELGQDMAAWIVLEGERCYWQCRNRAGQMQKSRQDQLGLGWANHDHHTFRSSRRQFPHLVRLFEMLGFHCRERFYAGKEAGWGAQVMENPRCGLVLFLDVDLAPEELEFDFSHHEMPEREELGTIGLWCALHGDSVLQAGMHHLEAQFSFEELTSDLAETGIGMMDPFSNFPYLKQAFTEGEMWSVSPKRVEKVVKEGRISAQEGEQFLAQGALGSHLENLQRKEGYKGFNQSNVSWIIKKTDPRKVKN